ncbi:bifunctional pyr operon transcriptional regulator/uracil phosphoribosyltransferase PyrR [Gleimia sp. 6138-11-ORH1]|uniref:bifunctional pyr operon transcriptional regulator/uracil phosphoribosyltransferase PyrR n=1 Tax=Gleimia sp. 6138-11-ORH1 TaxID=2973937 RepID=UPI002169DA69|nr:bifunctional pyr operon transcriptional regulator/uracil phosphoribosyltransferase PyrR [Gleimia sp. 6138-11-ORH1]MCS4484378.1 bifunctional pyr operon transcriptional regulator/uracil phosphoribosyltransferase PyrR [Gleimia sp. 6138-11-ORH1]
MNRRTKIVLNEDEMNRALTRISYEIIEYSDAISELVILGIPTRGEILAKRIGGKIAEITSRPVQVGTLDTTMYRDDLAKQPTRLPHPTEIPVSGIENKRVVLVDDVLYTGRTAKAALDALFALGRPSIVQLAVLVDRGHRELPIRPDFIGKNLPTSRQEIVTINCEEIDGTNSVVITGAA